MKLDFAVFAHSAFVLPNGTFSLLHGGYDWVAAKSFPTTMTDLVLLSRISFEASECGNNYDCIVKVSSPDGSILSPDLCIAMQPSINHRHPDEGNTLTCSFGYNGFVFMQPGFYRFALFIGDLQLGTAKIEFIKREVQ